ncbi:hypothetical protein JCGZ_07919 [Jatropha curcas]|uniref:C2 domain-containing protein n=2 Tax=Jatropha curcas TaxID=180498 RepID=A0A067JL52_JATCU|nr:hypothetical protein JCGZ_07919 [Jatropha curcas]
MWNEDLIFVVAEPFEEHLIFSVEDRVGPNKDEILGRCVIPLHIVERRIDHRPVNTRWFNLEKRIEEGAREPKLKFASRIHLRICLEGGYNVLDESWHYRSDLRPTAKQLWRTSIGILELGIIGAVGLKNMKSKDGRGTADAYCVAKYGRKWVRTRTIVDSLSPKWNEQYTWEVFDLCTSITIGVFDNGHIYGNAGGEEDIKIGKVQIQLSTLETGRVYTNSYPLLVLHSSGVKKMGEVHLSMRFTCLSFINMLSSYSHPLLPKMHYIHPLSVMQLDNSRHQTMQLVSLSLSRAEPPLRKEVVENMLEEHSHMWSMRRSKTNYFRFVGRLIAIGKGFDDICNWKHPFTTILIHIVFIFSVLHPKLIPPAFFFCLSMIGIWNYFWRPRHPPWVEDSLVSHANDSHIDELDEEFDTYPTSQPSDIVRMRYDRLRSWGGKVSTIAEDLASQGERFQYLVRWRDPRATTIFTIFCLIAAAFFYYIPFRIVVILTGIYVLRHRWFRSKLPLSPLNFLTRLPSRSDCLL